MNISIFHFNYYCNTAFLFILLSLFLLLLISIVSCHKPNFKKFNNSINFFTIWKYENEINAKNIPFKSNWNKTPINWLMYLKEFSDSFKLIYLIQRTPELFEFKKDFIRTYQYKISYTFCMGNEIYYVYLPGDLSGKGMLFILNSEYEPTNAFTIDNLKHFYVTMLKKLIPGCLLTIQRADNFEEMVELGYELINKELFRQRIKILLDLIIK